MTQTDFPTLKPGDAEPHEAQAPGGMLASITIILNGLSLVVALVLVFVLFFTWQSVGELSALEQRLAEIGKFEDRIARRLEVLNDGFHAQFDDLNMRLEGLTTETKAAKTDLARVTAEFNRTIRSFQYSAPAAESAAALEPPPREVTIPAPPAPPAPARPRSDPVPAASPQFERTVSPDGKVTYSRKD